MAADDCLAASVTLAAVFGSSMSPATSASFADAGNGFPAGYVSLQLRSNRCERVAKRPAPIPCEAPVAMAVYCDSVTCKLPADRGACHEPRVHSRVRLAALILSTGARTLYLGPLLRAVEAATPGLANLSRRMQGAA
jgi:hypothetical protein